MTTEATVANSGGRWRLGPSHPDHGYDGPYGYPVLETDARPHRAPRRSTWNGGKRGLIAHRRFSLTPEGAKAACAPAEAPSGHHSNCPPHIRHLCEGRLPEGWIKAGGAS